MRILIAQCALLLFSACQNEEVTFYRDVRPMLDTHCSRCHQEGGAGPVDFTVPDNAVALAEVMLGQIDSGQMPPPTSDPDCRDYDNSERLHMPQEARDLFAQWVENGSPLGSPDTLVTVEPLPTSLENPDFEVRIRSPYTPMFADESFAGNEYRCFVLDHNLSEDVYLTGMAPFVDQPSLVHHIVLSKVSGDIDEAYLKEEGWSCAGGEGPAGFVEGIVAAWAPGMLPISFPEGVGLKIGKDDRIVLQMHYFTDGDIGASDQSGYQFTTASSVDTEIVTKPYGPQSFVIPAGEEAHKESATYTLPEGSSGTIYGTFPHMHVLGAGYHFSVQQTDGSEQCMARSEGWDFENQMSLVFKEPIELRGGDQIRVECSWDNSASNPNQINDEPRDVQSGEGTDNEMCYSFTFLNLNED